MLEKSVSAAWPCTHHLLECCGACCSTTTLLPRLPSAAAFPPSISTVCVNIMLATKAAHSIFWLLSLPINMHRKCLKVNYRQHSEWQAGSGRRRGRTTLWLGCEAGCCLWTLVGVLNGRRDFNL